MAIFSDRIETAYYISEDYSNIQVEWKDDAGNIVIHICPADPENADFKALQDEGWDAEKLTAGTAAFKRLHNSGFNAMVNAQARKLARQMVADMRTQVESAERDRLANVREKATKEEVEAKEKLKSLREKHEKELKAYQDMRKTMDRDEHIAGLQTLREKIAREQADYDKLLSRIERDTALEDLAQNKKAAEEERQRFIKMREAEKIKLTNIQEEIDNKREKVVALNKDIKEKVDANKRIAQSIEERKALAKTMEDRIKAREDAAKAELDKIRQKLTEKENMTREQVQNLTIKLAEKEDYLKGLNKEVRKTEISSSNSVYELWIDNNTLKDEVFKFKLWALELPEIKEKATKEQKSSLRKVKSIAEGIAIIADVRKQEKPEG